MYNLERLTNLYQNRTDWVRVTGIGNTCFENVYGKARAFFPLEM